MEKKIDYTIDIVHNILDDLCAKIPSQLLADLNGGIILHDEIKYHEKAVQDNILVLGSYHRFGVRRQINIYYKSIKRAYPLMTRLALEEKLEELLLHELRHHIEYKARVKDLIDEDKKLLEMLKETDGLI